MMNDGLMGIRHRGTRLAGSSTGVKISSGDLEERSVVYGESDPTPPLSISIADTQPHLLESPGGVFTARRGGDRHQRRYSFS